MTSRVAWRMIAPFTLISVVLLGVGGGGAWYVHRLSRDASGVLAHNLDSLLASEELVLSIRDTRLPLHSFLTTSDHLELESALARRQETDKAFAAAERSATTPETRVLIARARAAHDHFFEELARLGSQPQTPTVRDRVADLTSELTDNVLAAAVQLLEHNRKTAAADSARNRVLADRVGLVLLLLGSCGAVAGLLAGFAIARGFSRSIVQLSLPVRDTAGKLGEIVGPISLAADAGLPELETVMRIIAEETGSVVTRLQDSQREALRREQLAAMGQLAAGLAHELRNPLMSMKILVQAAAAGSAVLGDQDLAVLAEEITRLEQLTRTFLDFARPEQLDKRVFDVRGLVAQTVRVVAGRAGQQQVVIECHVPEEPLAIEADAAQIRQVLLNLLLNALDALPGGGHATVKVSRERESLHGAAGASGSQSGPGRRQAEHDGNGELLCLRISDDGPGLPTELGQRIFDPFVSTRGTGMGLGLTICRRIVEAHTGTITAESRPEAGAEFTVRLPLAAARARTASRLEAGATPSAVVDEQAANTLRAR